MLRLGVPASTARRHLRHVQPAFDAIQPGVDSRVIVVGGRQQNPRADQFQVEPGRGGAAHLRQTGCENLGRASHLAGTQRTRLRRQPLGLIVGNVDKAGADGVGHLSDDHQIAHSLQQILGEPPGILTDLDHLVDGLEHALTVAGGEGVDDLV